MIACYVAFGFEQRDAILSKMEKLGWCLTRREDLPNDSFNLWFEKRKGENASGTESGKQQS